MGIPEGEEGEKGTGEIFEEIMTEFPHTNDGYQIIDLGSSEYTKHHTHTHTHHYT